MSKTNGLVPHTFDSGVKVMLRKVSPFLVVELRKKFPEPKPPMQEVEYGDGEKRLEPNFAHPQYTADLETYNLTLESNIRKLMITRGVVCDVDHAAVKELREYMSSEFGIDLDPDEKFVFISHIAVGSEEDLDDLLSKLTRRSQPTEEAVEEMAASFPGETSGS